MLADAAIGIERRERWIVEIDTALQPIQTSLTHLIETSASSPSQSEMSRFKSPAAAPPTIHAPGVAEPTTNAGSKPAQTPPATDAHTPSATVSFNPSSDPVPADQPGAEEKDGPSIAAGQESEDERDELTAPMKPMTIEGLPIKPTIAPLPRG